MARVEILDVVPAPLDAGRFWGAAIDLPKKGECRDQYAIVLAGWILHRAFDAPAVCAMSEGRVVARWPANLPRPDVAAAFPSLPISPLCGFEGVVDTLDLPVEFALRVELHGGTETQHLGTVYGRRSARGSRDPAPRVLDPEAVAALGAGSQFVSTYRPRDSAEATLRAVAEVHSWYQSLYLGHGFVVDGHRDTFSLLRILQLPDSLAGKTVLDVGSAEGFFSFECEARGAARVIALDEPAYRDEYPTIRRLKDLFGSRIELLDADVTRGDLPSADVTLFLGVLYHLQDPFLTLRRLREVTRDVLYLETHVVNVSLPKMAPFGDDEPPFAVFYERDELAGDSTNWWGPNLSCLLRMLRAAGFERLEVLSNLRDGDWHGRAVVRAAVGPAGNATASHWRPPGATPTSRSV